MKTSSKDALRSNASGENEIEFFKMEGCGNNFVVLSDFRTPSALSWPELSIRLMDRNFGIGGDGVMVLKSAPSDEYDFEVEMYNPDGSPMGMCGNGIRCVARYVMLNELIPPGREVIHFCVEGRNIACALRDRGNSVMVDMGPPSFEPQEIPIKSERALISEPYQTQAGKFEITCLSMGNPHCVIFVPDANAINLQEAGPKIEHDLLFPKRTNVEFVEVRSATDLHVRVWERGAGATLACGTAACAVLVAANVKGVAQTAATIHLPGGKVEVEWDQSRDRVYLTGPARDIFAGKFRVDNFISVRHDVN